MPIQQPLPNVPELAAPVAGLTLFQPNVLLASNQSISLLRHLDRQPKHCAITRRLLTETQTISMALSNFANDSFELAVVPSAPVAQMDDLVRELVRVARQGLITFA